MFHVSTSSAGTVRWQQISEDLVPVNISCIQDQPDYVFHITAYNSQVDKILDVRLTQPGNHSIIVCCLFCCCIHFDEEEIPQHSSSSHLIKDLEEVMEPLARSSTESRSGGVSSPHSSG